MTDPFNCERTYAGLLPLRGRVRDDLRDALVEGRALRVHGEGREGDEKGGGELDHCVDWLVKIESVELRVKIGRRDEGSLSTAPGSRA